MKKFEGHPVLGMTISSMLGGCVDLIRDVFSEEMCLVASAGIKGVTEKA